MKTAKSTYAQHRYHAEKRGIEFKFTFEQWIKWWEASLGPDWLSFRGCRKGQFVMARKGDKGPYEKSNVKCLTTEANLAEQSANGLSGFKKGCAVPTQRKEAPHKNGIKITPTQAREIYLLAGTQKEIARRYAVSERLVRLIKSKRVWSQVLP